MGGKERHALLPFPVVGTPTHSVLGVRGGLGNPPMLENLLWVIEKGAVGGTAFQNGHAGPEDGHHGHQQPDGVWRAQIPSLH